MTACRTNSSKVILPPHGKHKNRGVKSKCDKRLRVRRGIPDPDPYGCGFLSWNFLRITTNRVSVLS
jgi:hypothetical protein